MKKIILFSFVAASLCLSSCRKDRTCNCTITTTDVTGTDVSTTVQLVGHVTKGEAKKEANCYSYKATVTENGFSRQVTNDCKLN